MSATLQFTIAVARASKLSRDFATVRHPLNLERGRTCTDVTCRNIADGNGTYYYDSSLTSRSWIFSQLIRKRSSGYHNWCIGVNNSVLPLVLRL